MHGGVRKRGAYNNVRRKGKKEAAPHKSSLKAQQEGDQTIYKHKTNSVNIFGKKGVLNY